MASGPEGTEPLNFQTSVLKVSIHCEGCKKKVRKALQGLEGVYTIDINTKQNKVTVTGSVDADSLIRRLLKYNKHAELWPENKPTSSNSPGEAAGDAAAAAPTPKTEQQLPNIEQQQQTEEGKNKTTPPPTTEATPTPPAAAAISGEASASKPTIDAPNCNDKPPKPDKKDGEKPADACAEADDGKKKEKIAQRETSNKDEKAENAAAAGDIPSLPKQFPVYSVSYSAAQPSTSYAYYTSSTAAMPSSYTYSGYPPLPGNYLLDPYYGSMEASAASGGSYDMFNDENPNACNLM